MDHNVIGLVIEDFQNIKAMELSFKEEGGVVKLMGENEAGKTTSLDALITALSPGSVDRAMVQNGKESSKLKVKLSNGYSIEKVIKKEGAPVLKIKDEMGRNLPKSMGTATQFLKKIGNKLIDIDEFATMSDEDRTALLCDVAGIDKEELAKRQLAYKTAYDARTDLNRDYTKSKAAFDKLEKVDKVEENTPYQELLNERDGYTATQTEITRKRENLFQIQGGGMEIGFDPDELMGIPKINAEIAVLEAEIENLKRNLEKKQAALVIERDKEKDLLAENLEEQDENIKAKLDDVNKRITSADEVIKKYNEYQAYIQAEEEVENDRKAWEAKDTEVKNKKAEITELLNSKPMPMPDITIEDGVVFYKDVPYHRAAQSSRLEIAAILSMSSETKLKVIVIKDANRLGTKKLKNIADVAKEKGFLVLIEIVAEFPSLQDNTIYLEDGKIMSEEWKRSAIQRIALGGDND